MDLVARLILVKYCERSIVERVGCISDSIIVDPVLRVNHIISDGIQAETLLFPPINRGNDRGQVFIGVPSSRVKFHCCRADKEISIGQT